MEATIEKIGFQTYPAYKNSGVEWLGEIPENWSILRLGAFGTFAKGGGFSKANLSDDGTRAVLYGDIYTKYNIKVKEAVRFIPNEIAAKSISIQAGDLLFTGSGETKEEIGKCVVFLGSNKTVAGGDVIIFRSKIHSKTFLSYALNTEGIKFENAKNSKGEIVVHTYASKLKELRIPIPPLPEQKAIAEFLDKKTALIDKAIQIKEKQIALLQERRQILIQQAVTRGLDPNVPLKDSGVDWIGMIPEHWEVKRLKYVLKERNERSKDGLEPLLMVSQIHGLVVRSEYHEKAEVAQSSEGNKIVHYNDLVFNKLKAHLGVFFKSEIPFHGIVSPDYAVYFSQGVIEDLKYLELLFRKPEYIKEFICRATGIVEGLIRLYTFDLFDIQVPVPPIQEQKNILLHIQKYSDTILNTIKLKEKEIEKLKEYKSTLTNSAVTGKIKVS